MRARGIFLIVALAAQLHAVGAVKREKAVPVPAPARAPAEPKVPAPKRIILVTIDTWRWDALGASGSKKVATPTLDAFAKEGLYCRKAWVSSTLTAPSHATILTGLQPYQHGIRNNHGFRLERGTPTLALLLAEHGYATAAFVSAHPLAKSGGFDIGFTTYDDHVAPGDLLSVVPRWRKGSDTIDAASAWLRTAPDRFFLWVHLYDPHDPYTPPDPFRAAHRASPYYGEVAYADSLVGRLKTALGARGQTDALWVITGDHGEALGDHGEETHSLFVYDATARVPLILWGAGVRPGAIEFARSIDIAPTILALAGISRPSESDGRSLLSQKPPGDIRLAYMETMYPYLDFGAAPVRAMSDGQFKVIDVPQREAYDLTLDPAESKNLDADRRPQLDALRKALAKLPAAPRPGKAASQADEKSLKSLGYVGAGGGYALGKGGMDPKAFAPIYRKLNAVRLLVDQKKWKDAIAVYTQLLNDFPRSSVVACELGLVEMAIGKSADATTHLRLALDRNPTNSHALLGLANLAIERKDYKDAESKLLDVVELDPDDVEGNFNLGALYFQLLNQPAKAQKYWGRFLELQPEDPEAPRIRQMLAGLKP